MTDHNKYYPLNDEEQLRKKLGGMTINEPLFETGRIEEFEQACKNKDFLIAPI